MASQGSLLWACTLKARNKNTKVINKLVLIHYCSGEKRINILVVNHLIDVSLIKLLTFKSKIDEYVN